MAAPDNDRLALELKFRPPGTAGEWTRYATLTGTAAYDAWYFYHYGSEILRTRALHAGGCSFDQLPRKEKSLLVYLALAARPEWRNVLEIGSSLFEIIDGLELARSVLQGGAVPDVALESIEFLGLENSAFLVEAAQALHPGRSLRVFATPGSTDVGIDLIVDRATSGLVFGSAPELAAFLARGKAGVLNLLVSRQETFVSSVQDRPFTYFSLGELLDRLGGRLFHLFGEKAPGIDRSRGRAVVEGFFLYGDSKFADDFQALLGADARIAAFARDKRMVLRPAAELLS